MRRPLGLSFVLALVAAVPAAAQRLWLIDDRATVAGVDFNAGFFSHNQNYSPQFGGSSGLVTFFGRIRVDPKMMITAEVPFAHAEQSGTSFFSSGPSSTSTDRFGNPWIGVQGEFNRSVALEVGIRPSLPQASYVAPELASDIDFDHFDAWYDHSTMVRAVLHAGAVAPRGVFTTGIVGATAGVDISGFFVDYGVRAGYSWSGVTGTVSGTGRLAVSHSGVSSFDNRLFNQVEIGAAGTRGRLQPKIAVRGFVDPGIRRTIKAIVTVGVVYVLGEQPATPSP